MRATRTIPVSAVRFAAFAVVLFAGTMAMPAAPVADVVTETISLNYERITWDSTTKARIEADFSRIVAASGLKVSAAEIAGAAQAAFVGGTEYEDTWEQQTIIRGCGPAGDLCFVITCNNCRGAK